MKDYFSKTSDCTADQFQAIKRECVEEVCLLILNSGIPPTEDYLTTWVDRLIWDRYFIKMLRTDTVPEWPWGDTKPEKDIKAVGLSSTFRVWAIMREDWLKKDLEKIKAILNNN